MYLKTSKLKNGRIKALLEGVVFVVRTLFLLHNEHPANERHCQHMYIILHIANTYIFHIYVCMCAGQCGGKGAACEGKQCRDAMFSKSCCSPDKRPFACIRSNKYYWQCQPEYQPYNINIPADRYKLISTLPAKYQPPHCLNPRFPSEQCGGLKGPGLGEIMADAQYPNSCCVPHQDGSETHCQRLDKFMMICQ